MLRRVTVLVVVLFSVCASSAEAAYLKNLVIKDRGSRIHFYLTVCGGGGRHIDFETYVHVDQGIAPTYSDDVGGGRADGSCQRWDLPMQDRFSAGYWSGWVYGYINGQRLRSSTQYFRIS